MTENACQLVFRMLVTILLCFVVKAVSKLLWVRCYSVKVRPCLRACALAVALLALGGGLCLTPLPTTCTVCGYCGNTPVPSVNKVLTPAGPHLCCCSSLASSLLI